MRISFITLCFILLLCGSSCAKVDGNKYNPHMQSNLPDTASTEEQRAALKDIGAKVATIQDEAGHRKSWKEEIYPVAFGNPQSANEILVFLDYAHPESEKVWNEVTRAAKSLNPQTSKIVVFGHSKEQYGTELMGGGIWTISMKPEKALAYYSKTLQRWNIIKARQAQHNKSKPFTYEYDAVLTSTDQPILNAVLIELHLDTAIKNYADMVKYCYDAGNINMFQAVAMATNYGVRSFPAVVVNDVLIMHPTAEKIVQAAKRP